MNKLKVGDRVAIKASIGIPNIVEIGDFAVIKSACNGEYVIKMERSGETWVAAGAHLELMPCIMMSNGTCFKIGDIVTADANSGLWLRHYHGEIVGFNKSNEALLSLKKDLGTDKFFQWGVGASFKGYQLMHVVQEKQTIDTLDVIEKPTIAERRVAIAELDAVVKHVRGKLLLKEQQVEHYRQYYELKEKELASLVPITAEEELAELVAKHPHCIFMAEPITRTVYSSVIMNGELRSGLARCEPTDVFDETVGKLIALKRALGIKFDAFQYGEEMAPPLPLTKPADRGCGSCKHWALPIFDEPCGGCFRQGNWEAKVL